MLIYKILRNIDSKMITAKLNFKAYNSKLYKRNGDKTTTEQHLHRLLQSISMVFSTFS